MPQLWRRKTRVGGGTQAIWPPEQRSQQKQGGHRVPVQCSSHAPWCVWECVCGCVSGHLVLHPSPGRRAGGRCLSGEEPTAQAQLQLGPGGFGRGSKWRSLGPAEGRAQTPQGDHGAAEQATDATVQGLTSSPPASNLPSTPHIWLSSRPPNKHSGRQRTRTHPPFQQESKRWKENSVLRDGVGGY